MSLDVNKVDSNSKPAVPNQTVGWVALILGILVSMGALSWLMVSLLMGAPTQLVIHGVIQLGIGIFLIASKSIIPPNKRVLFIVAAFVSLLLNAVLGIWFGVGSLVTSASSSPGRNVLTARDPDSPIVVTVEDSRGSLQNHPVWSGTIYADGKRPTQYTGWPIHLIGKNANPTQLIWHNDDPDWVEIRLDTGQKLKLTWDPKAAFDARLIRDLHYYLNPEFELIR